MESLYSITCKLGMEMAGFTTAAGLATRFLGDIEGKAASADRTLEKLAQRFNLPVDQFVAQASSMGSYTKQIDAAAAAHANLATAMGGIGKIAVGAGLVGVGLAGVGVMKGWVSAASELQGAMAGVQLATLGVGSALQQASQLTTLQDMTYGVAAKTRFSAPDIANIEKIAATSGLNKRTDLISALPTLANAAEIALQLKGTSYEASVPAFVQMAHLFQAYGGKKFNSLLDLVGRASVVSGDTPATMENTLKYLIPSVNAYGLTPEDAISVAALASNVGLSGGKGGGSRIQAMFRSIAPLLSSRGALHNKALDKIEQLGGHQFFTHGNFEAAGGVTNLLTTVMRAMDRIPDQAKRMALLNAAFGAAGGTAISSLASEGAVARFHAIQGDLRPNGIASTGQMQQTLNATWVGQTATLATNMQSLSAILGQQLLPVLTPIVHGVVEMTGALVGFLSHHKDVAQFAAIFTLVASTAALVVGPIIAVSGAMQILAAAGITVSIAFGPITLAILGAAAAVGVVTLAVTHWSTIMDALTGKLGLTWQILSTGLTVLLAWELGLRAVTIATTIYTVATTLMSGAAGLATAAFAALDIALSPIVLTIVGITAAAAASVWVWQNWATVSAALTGKLGPVWQGVASLVSVLDPALPLIGLLSQAFHNWGSIMGAIGGTIRTLTTDFAKLIALMPSIPTLLEKGVLHLLPGGDQLAGMLGLGGGGGGAPAGVPATSTHHIVTHHASVVHLATTATHHNAVVHNHHAAATIQQATHAAHPAVVQNHHTTTAAHHTMTPTPTARGGDTHIHVHPGAAAIHVHPGPGHDHKKIADETAKAAGDHLGHHIANALRTSGALPSTTRPTLHQIGIS